MNSFNWKLTSIGVLALFMLTRCNKTDNNDVTTPSTTNRYQEAVFTTVQKTSDVLFGQSTTIGGTSNSLKLDFYAPQNDTETKRPLVVLAYGGGFSMGDKTQLAALAQKFTNYGYTAAAISYRLYDGPSPASNDNLKKEILFGMQDIKAAIRFFKKDAATVNTYKIDSTKIFLLGFSAGAMLALHTAYVNSSSEVAALDPGFQTIINNNGGLEGASGNPGYSSRFKAVINLSGSLLNKSYIQANDIPLLSVYGSSDNLMPINDGVFTLPSISSINVSGSNSLNTQASSVKVTTSAYAITGGDHFAPTTDTNGFAKMVAFLYSNL
jgi:predicted esterase